MNTAKRGKYTGILEELGEQIRVAYIDELQMTAEAAARAIGIALEAIREHAGGGAIYVPKGHLWAVTEKHRRIYQRFDGQNHEQLAHDFDLTPRQIQIIIKSILREEFERKQCKLFGDDDED